MSGSSTGLPLLGHLAELPPSREGSSTGLLTGLLRLVGLVCSTGLLTRLGLHEGLLKGLHELFLGLDDLKVGLWCGELLAMFRRAFCWLFIFSFVDKTLFLSASARFFTAASSASCCGWRLLESFTF